MNFDIKSLGDCTLDSPLLKKYSTEKPFYMEDNKRMRFRVFLGDDEPGKSGCFQLAGPRRKVYFDPKKTRSALVTCGGLCPGLNDVIRSIVMETFYMYGSESIIGIKNGYNGLNPEKGFGHIELSPDRVIDIHKNGGLFSDLQGEGPKIWKFSWTPLRNLKSISCTLLEVTEHYAVPIKYLNLL